MSKFALPLLCLITFFVQGCCNKVDCLDNSVYFEFRILKDGQDLVFGSNPTYNTDFIHVESLEDNYSPDLHINQINANFGLLLYEDFDLVLHLSENRSDTISSNIDLKSKRGCCNEYELVSVQYNGVQVCQGDCSNDVVNIFLD